MKSFCIIGLGRFGIALAKSLSARGREVLVIDSDEKNVSDIADTVTQAVLGDATQESVLRAAGVADYDCAIICMSENVNDSILALILLKEMGVPYVIARAGTERHAKVLSKLGADEIVYPEGDLGRELGRRLSYDGVRRFVEFSEDTTIAEVEAPKAWYGKNLIELDVRRRLSVNVLTVKREGAAGGTPDPSMKFCEGDLITVIGSDDAVNRFIERLGKA